MPDETRKQEIEEQEGEPLPPREMMSLLSTSPASGLGDVGLVQPVPPPETSPVPTEQPHGGPLPPVRADDGLMHTQGEGADSEPRSETITQSDSASAES